MYLRFKIQKLFAIVYYIMSKQINFFAYNITIIIEHNTYCFVTVIKNYDKDNRRTIKRS